MLAPRVVGGPAVPPPGTGTRVAKVFNVLTVTVASVLLPTRVQLPPARGVKATTRT